MNRYPVQSKNLMSYLNVQNQKPRIIKREKTVPKKYRREIRDDNVSFGFDSKKSNKYLNPTQTQHIIKQAPKIKRISIVRSDAKKESIKQIPIKYQVQPINSKLSGYKGIKIMDSQKSLNLFTNKNINFITTNPEDLNKIKFSEYF